MSYLIFMPIFFQVARVKLSTPCGKIAVETATNAFNKTVSVMIARWVNRIASENYAEIICFV